MSTKPMSRDLLYMTVVIMHDLREYFDKQFNVPYGLSRKEWQIISMLRNFPDGLSQKWAKKFIGVEPSYFTKMLNDLEDKGFIIREIDKRDRRNRIIRANPKSMKKINKIFEVLEDVNQSVQSDLSKTQHDQMYKNLDKILDNLSGYIKEN